MIRDLLILFCVGVKYFVAYILLHTKYRRILKEEYWLVAEKRTEARDNGYHMFRYLRQVRQISSAYYVITDNSQDAKKIDDIGGRVSFSSFKHCILYLGAKYLLYCQIDSRPYENVRGIQRLDFMCRKGQVRVYLKHGIAKDDVPNAYDFRKAKYDIFICGAKPEYDYYKKRYDYPDKNIAYTGLCRYDALIDKSTNNYCLFMPTFREWLRTSDSTKTRANEEEETRMIQSEFYNHYVSMLNEEDFTKFCSDKGITVYFYLHYTLQPYVSLFAASITNPNVIVCDRDEYDVQHLLLVSKLLVTDYSSVAFDFAYMNKPVVYDQFDYSSYRELHYHEGYFNYVRDGLGPVYYDKTDTLQWIKHMFSNDGNIEMEDEYRKRLCNFFILRDQRNCERVYNIAKEYSK